MIGGILLTHLADPAGSVARLVARLQPGGVLVVEYIDCSGHFCHPESAAFRRYVERYTTAARARGGDPEIGPKLPGLLAGAGHGTDVVYELADMGHAWPRAAGPGYLRARIRAPRLVMVAGVATCAAAATAASAGTNRATR